MLSHQDLPSWIPGQLLCSSDNLNWPGVNFRRYQYGPTTVDVPALSDYLVIWYRQGKTTLNRSLNGKWSSDVCKQGDITLLTSSEASAWEWNGNVDVCHTYIDGQFLNRIASDMTGRAVSGVTLKDMLSVKDERLCACIKALATEATEPNKGSNLFAESIATQLAVLLLRQYADISVPMIKKSHLAFSESQKNMLEDYVMANLSTDISREALNKLFNGNSWNFSQRFNQTFNTSLPNYIMMHRIHKAKELLRLDNVPIKAIVHDCGFSDQSHMTRCFQKYLGKTPANYRKTESLRLSNF